MSTFSDIIAAVTPICAAVVAIYTYKNNKVIHTTQKLLEVNTQATNELRATVNTVETKVDNNTKLTSDLTETVSVVKTQTDGIKDELVQKTKELGEAMGKALGRAEQKSETDADKTAGLKSNTPVEVVVVNDPLQVVIPKEQEPKKD